MTVHNLKTWPVYFRGVVSGMKCFEVRKNDRGFKVGDILLLHEWDPATKEYTGNHFAVKVMSVWPLMEPLEEYVAMDIEVA